MGNGLIKHIINVGNSYQVTASWPWLDRYNFHEIFLACQGAKFIPLNQPQITRAIPLFQERIY